MAHQSSGEKLVLRDEGERELWRSVVANLTSHDIALAYGQSKWDCADLTVRAYRERCGTPEPVADDALIARAEQAERDRDVLAKVVDQTMKSFGYFIDPAEYAVLSRCTPPASKEATNG